MKAGRRQRKCLRGAGGYGAEGLMCFRRASSPSALGAAGAEIKAELIAAGNAAAAAHAGDFDQEAPGDRQGEINQTIEDGEADRVDDETAPDGMKWEQR